MDIFILLVRVVLTSVINCECFPIDAASRVARTAYTLRALYYGIYDLVASFPIKCRHHLVTSSAQNVCSITHVCRPKIGIN